MTKKDEDLKNPLAYKTVFEITTSLISGLFFVTIGIFSELFYVKFTIEDMFFETILFFQTLLTIFLLSCICSLIGRMVAYLILKPMYNYVGYKFEVKIDGKKMEKEKTIQIFLLTQLIMSIVFTFGILVMVRETISERETFLSFLFAYIIIRVIMSGLVFIYRHKKVV